ncbi:MAG: hypothetical protein HDR02_04370 [Lachnospiraceae bacterium]|nr:hypothetical protein [Lachnospiraceae bacterium]
MVLLTGFCGTSSELLIKKAGCESIILPNNKIADSQLLIEKISLHRYDYVFSFGQKPNIKNKLYIETTARNMAARIQTNFEYDKLRSIFEANELSVQISDNAGTSFCNALYWNGLNYIYEKGIGTKMIFIHIPFCKNITDSEWFFDRILTAVKNMQMRQ